MVKKIQAVSEGGVLKPVETRRLKGLRFESPKHFEQFADHNVTLETVRALLSKIPGSMDADFQAERNER